VPAVGINAAVNSRDVGTFRRQLNEKKATPVCRALEGATNFRNWHFSEMARCLAGVRFARKTEHQRGRAPGFNPSSSHFRATSSTLSARHRNSAASSIERPDSIAALRSSISISVFDFSQQ
jgi:hypothetical protein